ncbi:retinal homeobox protein Rx1 [Striga asiatica]|uniref:Retinal homeobox protein Rx1 n=1 Tax=Striga asiatica TaxID=4170 RepID=A0A5A7RIF5_STRAF|nr:retinal homeobox protein Rx1 [Striga asiatica]
MPPKSKATRAKYPNELRPMRSVPSRSDITIRLRLVELRRLIWLGTVCGVWKDQYPTYLGSMTKAQLSPLLTLQKPCLTTQESMLVSSPQPRCICSSFVPIMSP